MTARTLGVLALTAPAAFLAPFLVTLAVLAWVS